MTATLSPISKTIAICICILAWLAPGLQLFILVRNAASNGLTIFETTSRFFGYFTILTNLLVAISLTARLWGSGSLRRFFSRFSVQTAIGLYIFIVGLTYNLLLRQLWQPKGLQQIADEALHVLVPALYVLYWWFFVPKRWLPWKELLYWLAYPFAYLLFALIRGSMDGFYPYPFLNVPELGYMKVMMYVAGISATLIIVGSIFIALSRRVRMAN